MKYVFQFWSWLKSVVEPYKWYLFAVDVILIILLAVLIICNIL
ncbi:hypothetical protein QI262_03785 [Staphylococcus saprophyticus]|nr:hypothetical protein [Staphylococcus saprophyticus]